MNACVLGPRNARPIIFAYLMRMIGRKGPGTRFISIIDFLNFLLLFRLYVSPSCTAISFLSL